MTRVILLFTIGIFLLIRLYTPLSMYESLSVALLVFMVGGFLDDLGNKLVILDIAILVTILTCLIVPISGYHYFDYNNRLARSWVIYMRVPSNDYYSFMFPATIAMIIGMKIPIFFRHRTYQKHVQYMINVRSYLANSKSQGLILVGIGIFSSLVESYVPSVIAQVFFLLRYLMFVGVFYCFYSNIPNKRIILSAVFLALIYRSVSSGMFGEMVFMGAMTIILIFLGTQWRYYAKLLVLLVGISGIVVLQGVKSVYRKQIWTKTGVDNKVALFSDILVDKVSTPSTLFSSERDLFGMYGRFNQGQIISNVLYSVPAKFPFANGETIYVSLAATIVPRVLWPDKPRAGGAFNFKRFLGIQLKGWSANISPFGEAYGNFGRTGGIVFMLFFGLLFNLLFQWLLKITVSTPSLILWFPYFFFYAVSIETDVLSMINSFTKAGVLAWVIYKFFPRIFKMKI